MPERLYGTVGKLDLKLPLSLDDTDTDTDIDIDRAGQTGGGLAIHDPRVRNAPVKPGGGRPGLRLETDRFTVLETDRFLILR
ncbi:hypothetical protein [Streptomyces scabiei]|uniref:hypothetical protein n=1 Tax=Streptomyces scabiei TaxID=1930 RepID=UPI0029B46A2B|nr:hypothetical protein [Streptomyces scabiei]MDX3521402.1 hypothetical protein [Streptomyces scabiei]